MIMEEQIVSLEVAKLLKKKDLMSFVHSLMQMKTYI